MGVTSPEKMNIPGQQRVKMLQFSIYRSSQSLESAVSAEIIKEKGEISFPLY
jgi:hypothetical protein